MSEPLRGPKGERGPEGVRMGTEASAEMWAKVNAALESSLTRAERRDRRLLLAVRAAIVLCVLVGVAVGPWLASSWVDYVGGVVAIAGWAALMLWWTRYRLRDG